MDPQDQGNKTNLTPPPPQATDKSANAPGQSAAGTDRAEIESDQAHQAHHVGGNRQGGAGKTIQPSEETKNQQATSQQSRALSGTTAPRKV